MQTDTLRLVLPEPHPGQVRVAADSARFKTLMCGRRWGKTEFEIINDSELALDGLAVGWFAPTYKIMDDAWRRFEDLLRPAVVSAKLSERRIVLCTGGSVEFWSLDNPDAGRSRFYDHLTVDEAGLVRNLGSIFWNALRPTLTDREGSATLTGTPKGRGDFMRLFNLGEDGNDPAWKSFRLPTSDNPYIPKAEIEEARRQMPEEVFRQEYEGQPADDGGNPFGHTAIEACVGPLSSAPPVCYGVDLAKSQDFTVYVGLDAEGRVCRFDRWQGPWDMTSVRLDSVIGGTPALVDSTGVGDPIVERLQKSCPKAEGFTFTSRSKQMIMEGLAVSIHKGEVVYPDNEIRRELDLFGYEYTPGGVRYEATSGAHDDCVCALALAVSLFNRLKRRPVVSFGGVSPARGQ